MNIEGIEGSETLANEEFDLKEIYRIIKLHRIPVLIIIALSLLITVYLTITTQPIYQATTIVMIKESSTDPSSFVFDFGPTSSRQRLQNEIEVLKSYYLHNEVVNSLIQDKSSKKLSLFGTRYVRKRYRLWDYAKEWVTKDVTRAVPPQELTFGEKIKVVEELRKHTRVSTVREADVLKVSLSSPDSTDAVFLANRIAQTYRKLDLAGGQGELHFVLAFLDTQITKYENRLLELEDKLKTYQIEYNIYSLDGSAELLLTDLTNYEGIYYTNLAELKVAQERIKYLKGQLSDSEIALMDEITNTNNPMIVALRGKIAELEAQKVQQMVDEGWSDESMQARDFNRRIGEMKLKLQTTTESLILSGWSEEDPFAASQDLFNKIVEQEVEVHAVRSRANEYKVLVDNLSNRLQQLPEKTLQYARLERDLKLNENLYLTMKQKYEESRITEAGKMGKVRILDPAIVALQTEPNIKLNAFLGIFFGLFFGLGYAFVKEMLDNTVKAVEQLERKGLTVLGIIPDMHHSKTKSNIADVRKPSTGGKDFRRRLIAHEDPKSPISESYRSLRTNITYSSPNKKIVSLLISSPQPGEGKSTTTANLAIAFAQLKKKTLLVDADLRKPVQHNVFGFPRSPGLSDYLIGETNNVEDIIQPVEIENLYLISAGTLPPNPSELLGSKGMEKLIAQLEDDWDIVLFDSPPIVAVTDASMISSEIDAIGLVVKAGQTDKAAIDRALDTISNVKAPLIGAILNGASPDTLSGKYSYYYSYYNYYYHSGEK